MPFCQNTLVFFIFSSFLPYNKLTFFISLCIYRLSVEYVMLQSVHSTPQVDAICMFILIFSSD